MARAGLHAAAGDRILSYDAGGRATVVAEGIAAIASAGSKGNLYAISRDGGAKQAVAHQSRRRKTSRRRRFEVPLAWPLLSTSGFFASPTAR